MKGFLITFEGIDSSGKSVQANLLKERLLSKNLPVIFLREPGGTEISERIREVLLDTKHQEMDRKTELLLYSAARSQVVAERIIPHLQQAGIVICDRLYDSTTAYQGYGRQIDLGFIKKIHNFVTEGITPDLTFLIDLDPAEATKRKAKSGMRIDRLEGEKKAFHERVRSGYLKIAEQEPERFVIVDGARAVSVIHEEIYQFVRRKIDGIVNRV
ncbi:MAG: dTMP kinase [bacterium]